MHCSNNGIIKPTFDQNIKNNSFERSEGEILVETNTKHIEGPPIRQFNLRVGTVAMNNPLASARMNWKRLKYQIRQIRGRRCFNSI